MTNISVQSWFATPQNRDSATQDYQRPLQNEIRNISFLQRTKHNITCFSHSLIVYVLKHWFILYYINVEVQLLFIVYMAHRS